MNNNLIITHKDGRTWNEGQIGDFLKSEGTLVRIEELETLNKKWDEELAIKEHSNELLLKTISELEAKVKQLDRDF